MNAFHHVLVGLDLESVNAPSILSRACQVAETDDIEVVHVCEHLHTRHEDYGTGEFANSEELDLHVTAAADSRLDNLCKDFGITHHQVLRGKPADAMHDYARTHADLVVVGSHGHHGLQAIFGSKSDAMLRDSPCDVLAVHIADDSENVPVGYRKILVAVNLAEESETVLEHAMRIAEASGGSVAVCHVYTSHDKKAEAVERRKLRELSEKFKVGKRARYSLSGKTANAIRELANNIGADLIVVGTHDNHGLELITGSTTSAVTHSATCDTLSVRVA